ncbi:hypothetical protein [Hymenobacter busanensis]|nr:hypothetical protein [Hymenobacter busanensis]QHJ08023.1 hypothetical protein GUY19_12305 [Hymenobacter busanensis]
MVQTATTAKVQNRNLTDSPERMAAINVWDALLRQGMFLTNHANAI